MDSDGNIVAGISFIGSALSIVKITKGVKMRNGNLSPMNIDWNTQLTADSVASMQLSPDLCINPEGTFIYATTSVLYYNGTEQITTGALAQISLASGDVRWFKRNLAVNSMG